MKRLLIMIVVTMCMMPELLNSSVMSSAETSFSVTAFNKGDRSVIVGFPMAGMDDSNHISIQTGLTIDDAAVKVSTMHPTSGNKDYPSNVSVDFGADGVAEWQFIGKGVGDLGRQTLFNTGSPQVEMDFRTMSSNGSLAIRLPKNAHVSMARLNASLASTGRYLIIHSCSGYPGLVPKIQEFLRAYPDVKVVDDFDGGANTPTLDVLQQYNSVLLFNLAYNSKRWANQAGLGNVLADYVDGGGGVVLCLYLWMSGWQGQVTGRFNTAYYCWNPTLSGMSCGSTLAWGSAQLPQHPVMEGVKSVNIPGQMWTGSVSLCGDAQTVFKWGNSAQGCAVRTVNGVNRVDIQMTPYPAAASAPTYSYGWGGDGGQLIKNALAWTSGKASGGGGGSTGVAVDILKDGSEEFNQTTFEGVYSFPDMTAKFNNYLASADVSYVDAYGNEFVDLPINVTPFGRTTVIFSDLDVVYSLTTDIDQNPVLGDLASCLGELTSPRPGSYNTTIPILVTSTSAGRLKLHDLRISLHAPFHKPSITSFFPAATAVVKEGTTLELGINATDWYGAPLTYKWFYEGEEVAGVAGDRMTVEYGFKDAGNHMVRVEVANPDQTVLHEWKIAVQNVNRAPQISAVSPEGDQTISEGSSLAFSVQATDPDEDPIGYIWILDNVVQGSSSSAAFTYRTDFTSAGVHMLKVTAVDPGSLSAVEKWTVHVKNVDRPPLLTAWEPKDDPTMIENQQQLFTVGATDEDGQELAVSWSLDGTSVSAGNSYLYKTDHSSAGIKTLKVTATDGELWASHEWEITVLDLNRPPTAAIGSPKNNAEFGEGTAIHFSAGSSSDPDGEKLSYSWKEGAIMVSDQAEFDMAFAHGLHTLVLEVRDHAGAVSQATVHFRVRWVELSLVMGLDRLDASAGDNVMIIVTMGNVGDTRAADQKLDILVDGKRIATEDLPTLDSSGSYRTQFQWKATKGAHTITAVVGDQSWNQPVSVAGGKTAAAGAAFNDLMWMVLIVVLAVALAIWGMYAMGKKE